MRGVCKLCGCTENSACNHPDFGTCFWVTPEQDLCSHCVEFKNDPAVERPEKSYRALSWREPFASLMLPPFNKIETRSWSTKYRGPVLICASQKAYSGNTVARICGEKQWYRIIDLISNKELYGPGHISASGNAIASGYLVDCRPMTKADEEKCFVQYFPDLWCHVYEDVRPIKPFPWKGTRRWAILTEEQISKIQSI